MKSRFGLTSVILLFCMLSPTFGRQATTKVLAPNGGEKLEIGSVYEIKWSGGKGIGAVDILLLRHDRVVGEIDGNVRSQVGSYIWKVGVTKKGQVNPGDGYKIVIRSTNRRSEDQSDRPFVIAARPSDPSTEEQPTPAAQPASGTQTVLSITRPEAGARWCIGKQNSIQWTSSNIPATTNLKIELLNTMGSLFKVITGSTPNTGSYAWDISATQYNFGEGSFKIRISALDNTASTTGPDFKLGKELSLRAPMSNHTWRKGSSYRIEWLNGCTIPSTALNIDLLSAGKQPVRTIASAVPIDRTYQWLVPTDLVPGTYYIKLTTTDNLFTAEGSFALDEPVAAPVSNPQITILKPDETTKWCIGGQYQIQWSSTLPASANFKIELLLTNNAPWKVITTSAPNTGSYLFDIQPQQYNFGLGVYRMRIGTQDGTIYSETQNFSIGKQLFIDAPKSNYTWRKGSSYNIVWTVGCAIPSTGIKIDLLDASKNFVAAVATNLPLNLVYKWTVPGGLASGTYYIRVSTTDGQYTAESSFTIGDPL